MRTDRKLKVFISYSRRDIAFAEKLVAALEARAIAPRIDLRDLPKLEDWRRELLGFIREADAVVFIISSSSIASPVCGWEVAQVEGLRKRLAPIVLERVPNDNVPETISRINYLFFDRPDEFDSQVDTLVSALQTDLPWLKDHTRLGELSRRWSERQKSSALLLRGHELDDAEHWIAGRPRGAPEPTEDTREFIRSSRRSATRRRNILTGSLMAGAAVAVGLALFAFWQRAAAIAGEERAVAERNEALRSQSRFLAERAIRSLDDPDPERSLLLALEAMPGDLANPDRPHVPEAEDAVRQSALSLLAAKTRKGEGDKGALGWLGPDSPPEKPVETRSPSPFRSISIGRALQSDNTFSNDGRYVATSYADARVLDTSTGRTWGPFGVNRWSVNPQFSNDSTHIFARTGDNFARLWKFETGQLVLQVRGWDTDDINRVDRVFLSNDNAHLMTTADGDRLLLRVWARDGRRTAEIVLAHAKPVGFSPSGKYFVASPKDGSFAIFETATGAVAWRWARPGVRVNDVAFSADESWIAIASSDSDVVLSRIAGGESDLLLEGHSQGVDLVRLSRNGKRLSTASSDGTIRVWDRERLSQVAVMRTGPSRTITKLLFVADDTRVVTDGPNQKVGLWDVATGAYLGDLEGASSGELSDVSADGSKIAVQEGRSVRISDAFTGALFLSVPFMNGYAGKAKFSNDGKYLFAAEQLRPLSRWPLYPQFDALFDDARGEVSRCLSPDERKAAFLPSTPPTWCITGPLHKITSSPEIWEPKPPYDKPAWRQWLVEKRSGGNPPPPSD